MNAFIKQLFPEKRFALLLGVAFPMLWMSVAGLSSAQMYLFCNIGVLLAFSIIYILNRSNENFNQKLLSPLVFAACLICLTLPTIDILFPSNYSFLLWVLGGIGLGTSFVSWFEVATRTPIASASSAICLGTILAFCIQMVFELGALGTAGDATILLLCAVCSPLLLLQAQKISSPAHEISQLPAPDARFMTGLLTPFALLAIYFGFSHNFPSGILGGAHISLPWALGIGSIIIAGVFAWLVLRSNRADSARLFGMVAFTLVLLGIVALFIDRSNKTLLLATQVSCRAITVILLWLLAAEFSKRNSFHPISFFCQLMAFYTVCLCVGLYIGTLAPVQDFLIAFPQEGIYLFTACMIAAITYGLLVVADFFRESSGNKELTIVLETSFLDQQCSQLAAQHELSKRETEIIQLLAQGRSRSYIAENLYLSENTVKWYCRQIYQKLGIHKKQELLTLLGVE